jgi:catechol 2,3-dioxygenase-like lactoylglutathione lyase family enzyme
MAPRLELSGVVLDTPDPVGLADFYRRLLGWAVTEQEPGWVTLRPAGGGTALSFQEEPEHRPPVWPAGPDDPRMQLHLDIEVDDLAAAERHAVAAGAVVADFQPQEHVRVLQDPAGHPFCLFLPD